MSQPLVAIIGGGPAGLMVADCLSAAGVQVDLYDAMPSVGRKFLLAGRGGLNITHSEPAEPFLKRYGRTQAWVGPWLDRFDGPALRDWVHQQGIDTFVGSSGRVFPTDMKAAPLLRSWLHRLRLAGVRVHTRHRWTGFTTDGALSLDSPNGPLAIRPVATVLALGGGSWKRLGSDGRWLPWLQARGVDVTPLAPSNCGFDLGTLPGREHAGWTPHLRTHWAGQPVKPVALSFTDTDGRNHRQQGEFVITDTGVEGSLIYAFSSAIRERIDRDGSATIALDLLPDHSPERVLAEVSHARGTRSLSSHLKSRLGLHGLKMALLHECLSREALLDPRTLASAIKALPLPLSAPRPIDEAISTAGGVSRAGMTEALMLKTLPGTFCAGEMLDWDAPTGGYLLTATMASARVAAAGVLDWLAQAPPKVPAA